MPKQKWLWNLDSRLCLGLSSTLHGFRLFGTRANFGIDSIKGNGNEIFHVWHWGCNCGTVSLHGRYESLAAVQGQVSVKVGHSVVRLDDRIPDHDISSEVFSAQSEASHHHIRIVA